LDLNPLTLRRRRVRQIAIARSPVWACSRQRSAAVRTSSPVWARSPSSRTPGPIASDILFATWYLTTHPGDELGLRRIIGHVSDGVLADYLRFAQTTISQRAGNSLCPKRSACPPWRSSRCRPSPADAANLWPEPWTGVANAHMKDAVETHLRREVCRGAVSLAKAHARLRLTG